MKGKNAKKINGQETPPSEMEARVYEPSSTSALTLWWVDDCFNNREAGRGGGGYVSFSKVIRGQVEDIDNQNAWIFEDLKEIARAEGVNMNICSFEYADENWSHLDKSTNAILIDVGYEGKPKSDEYGIEFYFRKTSQRKPSAICSFLTAKVKSVTEWANQAGNWHPEIPWPIDKIRDFGSQVEKIAEYLKKNQPRGASEWDAETWQNLRDEAWETCDRYGSFVKAHHFPGGGHSLPETNEEKEQQARLNRELYEQLSRAGGTAVRQLPEHNWGKRESDIPVWDRPPIRAIAQFDRDGHDLTAVLDLVEKDVRGELGNVDLNVIFQPSRLEHDYLWFNACALSKGLHRLAEGFSDEIKKPSQGTSTGCINWHVREKSEGLYILISQDLRKEGEAGKKDPQLYRHPYELKAEDSATGQVKEAYRFFKKAGAQSLTTRSDGSLLVFIPSHPEQVDEHTTIWKLKR